ncbi:hypothetical protein ANRL1_03457 [Anaerolineae bacterium]|nr:hypothetical protein ANRL1_03457 [Anaerolineae bacterium]
MKVRLASSRGHDPVKRFCSTRIAITSASPLARNGRAIPDALMVLTDIISDPYPGYSVIPSRCRVTYDRRLLPGETIESVLGALPALTVESHYAEAPL